MGSYATTTSFSKLIPYSLRGNTTTSDSEGTAIFSKHIDRAEAIVNSYIATRYSLPLSPVPELIRTLTEDIASYFFIRGVFVQDGERKNEYLEAFRDAFEMLKQIKAGQIQLVDTSGSLLTPLSSSRYRSSTKDYTPIFDLDTETAWEVDSDLLNDISDARD